MLLKSGRLDKNFKSCVTFYFNNESIIASHSNFSLDVEIVVERLKLVWKLACSRIE